MTEFEYIKQFFPNISEITTEIRRFMNEITIILITSLNILIITILIMIMVIKFSCSFSVFASFFWFSISLNYKISTIFVSIAFHISLYYALSTFKAVKRSDLYCNLYVTTKWFSTKRILCSKVSRFSHIEKHNNSKHKIVI